MTDTSRPNMRLLHTWPARLRATPSHFVALTVLWMIVFATGCGEQHEASVSGTVTLDGTPLKCGTVTFHPVADGSLAYGQIDSAGHYLLHTGTDKGLVGGEYVVTVAATTPPTSISRFEELPGKLLTPARYSDPKKSGLQFTVTSGTNQFDIPLVSQ